MKHLGVDFGVRRVGLALSDPGGRMAFPLETIVRTTREALFERLLEIIAREGVEVVVVGLPRRGDGAEGLIQRQIRNFVDSLRRRIELPIHLVDETLSSEAAQDDLDAAGLARSRQGKVLDQQAAVRLLETHLSSASGRTPDQA